MESLVKKLQTEANITEEQATQVLKTIRSYMKENDIQIDWSDFMESKAKKLSDSTKKFLNDFLMKAQGVGDRLDQWADKTQDKLDDLSDKTKNKLDDLGEKAKETFQGTDKK